MWKNTAQPGRPQMTIWRMRIACQVPKATNTRTKCILLLLFSLPQRLQERVSMLCYTLHCCLINDGCVTASKSLQRLVLKEFLTILVSSQAFKLSPRETQKPVCGKRQLLTVSVNMERVRLPQTTVQWFVPYRINFHDPNWQSEGCTFTNRLHFPNKILLKSLFHYTDRSAWHA